MLVIGNKKYRNLQEQVGWNTEQIDKIFEFLDGINVSDNVVVVLDISTPLTAEELEIVNREVAFIVYNGELYFKRNQDSTYIYFNIVFQVSQGTVVTLASSEISVTKSNGALGIANSSVDLYSKTQIDNNFASLSYLSTQLALKANLAGANFTGAITAPSIIENMSGYSIERYGSALTNWTPIYVGAVKNGNKLTCVIFGTYNSSSTPANQALLNINIPDSVGSNLYPYTLGVDDDVLDTKIINFFDGLNSYKSAIIEIEKNSNSKLSVVLRPIDLVANTTYYFRAEVTFLLSDNLAS